MRILGIDYGRKHIGLAIGETEIRIASPLKEIERKKALEELENIILAENISRIVIGLPLSFDMQETEASREVRQFGGDVWQKFKVPVEYENEILTSTQIEREGGRKSHAAAAALILQSWFDRHR